MGKGRYRILFVVLLASSLALGGCSKKPKRTEPQVAAEQEPPPNATGSPKPKTEASKPSPTPQPTPQRKVAVSTRPPPTELWREFSGRRALETAGKLAALGPRPTGSRELEAARQVFVPALEGAAWEVENDSFQPPAPPEGITAVNLVARFSSDGVRPVPRTARRIVIVAPYDTRSFSTIRFVGANDGGSGPAMLLELARV